MAIRYRPEIDGLRTIAVVAVIIYHAEFFLNGNKFLPGGFLGVDVFFVISGFLITSLMLKELHHTKRLSISNFYHRRVRRLLPSLLTVMLVSIPLAWFILLPNQLIDFANSLISSLLFGSNFYWNYSLQEYGVESALLKPFLHTWSLAVEEQYYIIYPLILLAAFRWINKNNVLFITTLMVISLAFAEWQTKQNASFSFYMLPSRFWELLAGGLLAHLQFNNPKLNDNKFYKFLPSLGLLLIFMSFFIIQVEKNHPGLITIIPVIGTVLIIFAANKGDLAIKLLSNKSFVAIGLISYSLYLWHYPIFAFLRIEGQFETASDKVLAIFITFIFATASFWSVEKWFRSSRFISDKLFFSIVIIVSSIIGFLSYTTIINDGFPARYPKIITNIETNVLLSRVCDDKIICSFQKKHLPELYLVGDSHFMPLEAPLLNYAKANNLRLNIMNRSGCLYITGLDRVNKESRKIKKNCSSEFQNKRRKILISVKPSIIILGGRLPLILSEDRFNNEEGGDEGDMHDVFQYPNTNSSTHADRASAIKSEYKNSILELVKHGHKVVLVYPIPEVGWDVPSKLRKTLKNKGENQFSNLSEFAITTSYETYVKRTKETFNLLNSIQHDGISRVYPDEVFCNFRMSGRCDTHDTVNSFYRDDDHLSAVGAEMLTEKITQILEFE